MTHPRTAAVIGLGLIGGSIARALAAKGLRVLGFDADRESTEAARQCGVLAEVLDSSVTGLRDAEWVIISLPLRSAIQSLGRISERAGAATLITDTCSTKRSIAAEAARLAIGGRFVGSHPMTGSHRRGWSASRADLFDGSTTYLCVEDSAESAESAIALEAAQDLWTLVGSHTERISAVDHDRKVAATSHLPHVLSTTLAITLGESGTDADDLGPGGRDMVRIAAGDDAMWTEILLDNADFVAEAADAYLSNLERFRDSLANRDANSVRRDLAAGRRWTALPS